MVVVIIASVYFFELGIDISIVVALICVTGYVLEIFKIDTKQKVMLKIIRHPHSCVDCGLCSRTCPQGIDVADLEVVKHPDCNVCGDCVSSCPKEGALTLNQSLNINWLPSVLVVVLLLTGLFLGISWNCQQFQKLGVHQRKCKDQRSLSWIICVTSPALAVLWDLCVK